MSKFILQQLINFCIIENKQANHKKCAISWKREDAALENISIISKIHKRYHERWTIEFTDLYIYSNTFNPNFEFLPVMLVLANHLDGHGLDKTLVLKHFATNMYLKEIHIHDDVQS